MMFTNRASTERITVWQCIGCGKIEGPQPCVGICQDRKVEVVYTTAYEEATTELTFTHQRVQIIEAFIRRLAHTTPHEDEWKRSYLAMQEEARRLLTGVDRNK